MPLKRISGGGDGGGGGDGDGGGGGGDRAPSSIQLEPDNSKNESVYLLAYVHEY
jgi:hypothetical protein